MTDAKDITVVVCAMNSVKTMKEVLTALKKNNPLEIILVDGESTDGTREIAQKYVDKILTDPAKGLAVARNIGVKAAKGKYIFFCGADNVVEADTLVKMKVYMEKKGYVGVGALTELKDKNRSYWTQGANQRWKTRFYEGERAVIGTPYLYETAILEKYQYSPEMTWSDDSDVCYRIVNDGSRIGYSNVVCKEIGVETFKSLITRYRLYGLSDFQYYQKFSKDWNIRRKIKSGLHPILVELIEPLHRTEGFKTKLYYLPFFTLITIFRYKGWIISVRKKRQRVK